MADNAVIPLAVPDLRGNETAYLARCVAENWVSSAGPEVRALETRMAQLCGVDHAVATVNGTTALHLALITAGVGPGDLVALGARVIEKHFTLDRTLPGPDHQASLEPDALAAMITRLRQTVTALGDGEKRPAPGEIETAALVRRSWHAMRDLVAGAVVGGSDVVLKRPADGLDPASSPVGRTLVNPVDAGAPVRAGDLS